MPNTDIHLDDDEMIRLPEVLRRTGASATTIHRWERAGHFPNRLKIGPRMVGWHLREVQDWVARRERA